MSQIELFSDLQKEIFSYLKPHSWMQIIYIT